MARAILAGQPISYFPNGYPIIIAVTIACFGEDEAYHVLIYINIILSALSVFFAVRLTEKLVGTKEAFICGILMAVWPNQVNYVRQLLSEVLATFALVFAFYLQYFGAFTAGFMFFVSSLVRTTALPVAPLLSLISFSERRILHGVMIIMGLMSGYMINFVEVERGAIKESSNTGSNLLIAISSTSTDGISFSTEKFTPAERAAPIHTYFEFAVNHPKAFIEQRVSSLWELWGPWPGPGNKTNPRSTMARLLIGLRFPLLLVAMIEFWRNVRREDYLRLMTPVVSVTIIHTLYFSTPRFTYEAEPFIFILASGWIARRVSRIFSPRTNIMRTD
jgi:hypothetical protein